MASDSGMPASTSSRTALMIFLNLAFCVCSSRMYSARRTARPELIIVANCRAKTALSRALIRVVPSSSSFKLGRLRFSSSFRTVKPFRRSSATTAALESPANSPENGPPRSLLAVYVKVATLVPLLRRSPSRYRALLSSTIGRRGER